MYNLLFVIVERHEFFFFHWVLFSEFEFEFEFILDSTLRGALHSDTERHWRLSRFNNSKNSRPR